MLTRGVQGLGQLGQWAELISTIASVGGKLYSAEINRDIQNAQLELAKVNAATIADRLQAQQLQAKLQAEAAASAQAKAAAAAGVSTAALAGGGLALLLIPGGLLTFMLLRRRKSR